MWRNEIALMLSGYRDCWTYKTKTLKNISNITFTQLQVKEALNRIYMERWDVHKNGNPDNTGIGYTMCR